VPDFCQSEQLDLSHRDHRDPLIMITEIGIVIPREYSSLRCLLSGSESTVS